MKNIAKKILAISSEMGRLPKNGFNAFHKYNYVLESDAVDKLRDLCVKHQLAVIPSLANGECVSHNGNITNLAVSYKIIDAESGETLETIVPGSGQDSGDKGVYKALTGSYKYFVIKTFMVPTGDDPERDEAPKQQPPKQQYKPAAKPQPKPLDQNKEKIKQEIIALLLAIAGPDAEAISHTLIEATEWQRPDGSIIAGVDSPEKLNYEIKEGKKVSQAQVALRKLRTIAEEKGIVVQDREPSHE